METYKTKFLCSEFIEDEGVVIVNWLPESESLSDESFKSESLNNLSFVLSRKPKKILSNTLDLRFPVHPNLQVWFNQNILKKELEIGVEKIAVVVSSDLITQLGVEQILEEEEGQKFTTHYFDNKEEAWQWIISN